jgi:hypothetical protein
MTDNIKEQGGVGLPGQAQPVRMVSTKLNADGELPKPKPEQPKIIGGSPQPGHPPPTVLSSGPAKA